MYKIVPIALPIMYSSFILRILILIYPNKFFTPIREKHSDLTLHPFCSVKTGKQHYLNLYQAQVTCIIETEHNSWLYYMIDT